MDKDVVIGVEEGTTGLFCSWFWIQSGKVLFHTGMKA